MVISFAFLSIAFLATGTQYSKYLILKYSCEYSTGYLLYVIFEDFFYKSWEWLFSLIPSTEKYIVEWFLSDFMLTRPWREIWKYIFRINESTNVIFTSPMEMSLDKIYPYKCSWNSYLEILISDQGWETMGN